MRVIVGTLAGLGLAVTVAAAQPPAQRERAAVLKTPVPLRADQMPPVARGVADDFPPPGGSSFPSTPLKRAGSASGPGPQWLGGADPNVLPAGGATPTGGGVRQLTPPVAAASDGRAAQPKFLDRLKGAGERPPAPTPQQPRRTAGQQPEVPTAETPFRGTGANGAPVYAGPPAYRWYGWGTVTPGANPLAPAGQYPKASANWYSITGATPGAFPVPITNGVPVTPGSEPPSYGMAHTVPAAPPATPIRQYEPTWQPQPVTQPRPTPPAAPISQRPLQEGHRLPAAVGSKFLPGSSIAATLPAPVSVPTLAAPPAPNPVATAPAAMPMPKPDSLATRPVAAPPVIPMPLPPAPKTEAVAAQPPPPTSPAKPVLLTTEQKSIAAEPKPLPTSVMTDPPREQPRWQPATRPTTPPPGTWAPAQGVGPLPTVEPSPAVGGLDVRPIVARGQVDDAGPDPVGAVVKRVCQGRAEGVEVRATGTKKLQVCFETGTATAAKQLVADISKCPELTAYQIDFCVLVK
jgi:hypothetical protein